VEPGDAIREAREARGWTIDATAKRAGIGFQQLKNLEDGKTTPERVNAKTLFSVLFVFWPDLQIADLLPWAGALVRAEPASPAAAGVLVANTSSERVKRAMRELAITVW